MTLGRRFWRGLVHRTYYKVSFFMFYIYIYNAKQALLARSRAYIHTYIHRELEDDIRLGENIAANQIRPGVSQPQLNAIDAKSQTGTSQPTRYVSYQNGGYRGDAAGGGQGGASQDKLVYRTSDPAKELEGAAIQVCMCLRMHIYIIYI